MPRFTAVDFRGLRACVAIRRKPWLKRSGGGKPPGPRVPVKSMKRQHRPQNHLLREADALLRGRAQERAKLDACRMDASAIFRAMPKDERKKLTERFKAQREAGMIFRQSWSDWLFIELERDHGLSLQRTPGSDHPEH